MSLQPSNLFDSGSFRSRLSTFWLLYPEGVETRAWSMPFVWNSGPLLEPPVKRRKLSVGMARHSSPQSEDVDEQFLFEPAESLDDRSGLQEESQEESEQEYSTNE